MACQKTKDKNDEQKQHLKMHSGEIIKNIEHKNDKLFMNILKVYT